MIQLLATGLSMGCIYALVALSFILIYNSTGALNFAQGELVMMGAFLAAWLGMSVGLPLVAVFFTVVVAMTIIGHLFQRISFYPLRDKPFITFIIATIGMGIALKNLAMIIWGAQPRGMNPFFGADYITIGKIVFTPEQIFIVVLTAALLLGQYLLFFKTSLGKKMRATAQDQETAKVMGIKVYRMIALTFMLSSALAGIAGVLLAPIFFADIDMGGNLILKAFIAVIIGGFGSVPGAVVGGIIVGLMEIMLAAFISSTYKDAMVFTILIIFLFFLPQGIFGERIAEKV